MHGSYFLCPTQRWVITAHVYKTFKDKVHSVGYFVQVLRTASLHATVQAAS